MVPSRMIPGPLPDDTLRLILGRASSTLKGLRVHPGVIDSDYTAKIKVMLESLSGVLVISPGDKIAQLLFLPSHHMLLLAKEKEWGSGCFGSTGDPLAFISLQLDVRPTLMVEGVKITGLLDTGADHSIIASKDWPKTRPVQTSTHSLQELGYSQSPLLSSRHLSWRDEEGHFSFINSYVLQLPVTLWGRELLHDMNLRLTNEYSLQSKNIMKAMGHYPKFAWANASRDE